MNFAVVDIQGFIVNKRFFPKELTIQIGDAIGHYIFRPQTPFVELSERDKADVRLLERHNGHRYSSGYVEPRYLKDILWRALRHTPTIYLRGRLKASIVREALSSSVVCRVINLGEDVEKFKDAPKIEPTYKPMCLDHDSAWAARCTINNCRRISEWIRSRPGAP